MLPERAFLLFVGIIVGVLLAVGIYLWTDSDDE